MVFLNKNLLVTASYTVPIKPQTAVCTQDLGCWPRRWILPLKHLSDV